MDVLTREDAIKRINDLDREIEVDHLKFDNLMHNQAGIVGAMNELKAIFNIKEGELK